MLKRNTGYVPSTLDTNDTKPAVTPNDYLYNSGGVSYKSGTGAGKTLIGEHIVIEGTIRADEDLLLDGTLKGSIEMKSSKFTIGPKGKVEGDVFAESVSIGGRMTGNINATGKIELTRNADFSGEIRGGSISIEDGATLKASIELDKNGTKQTLSGPGKSSVATGSKTTTDTAPA